MEVIKTALPGSRLEVRMNMSAAEVDKAFAVVYQEVSDQGGIPGFRPGKAPARVIRRRVGEDAAREMAWMRLIEEHYPAMLEQEEIHAIGDPTFPSLEDIAFEEGAPLEFTISMTVRPVPNIRQYTGFSLLRPSAEVTDEQLEEALEKLRQTAAEISDTERDTVAEGDAVTAAFSVVPEGEEPPTDTSEQEFIIGSGDYQPAIDIEMIGKKVGDTVTLEHQYPEDYHAAVVAGKKVTVTATIESIMERVVPELNDEFAASQGEFTTLDQLKDMLREQLARQMQEAARAELEQNALAAVMANTTVDAPDLLVNDLANAGFDNFVHRLEQDGLKLESLTEIAQVSEEDIRANERLRAEALIKFHLALAHIAHEEEIEADEDDIDAEIARFAEQSDVSFDFVKDAVDVQDDLMEQFFDRALRNKIISFVVDSSEIVDVPRDQYPKAKEEQQARLTELSERLRAEEAAAAAPESAGETPADGAPETEQAQSAGEQTPDDGQTTEVPAETDTDTGEQAAAAEAPADDTPAEAEPSDTRADSE